MKISHLDHLVLTVDDIDATIEFYTEILDFQLLEDTKLSEEKRWVRVKPPGAGTCSILLAKASNEDQKAVVGRQAGGRVWLFLYTDDFWRDYNKIQERGVKIIRPPAEEPYGTVAVFSDLYGNKWDLLEPSNS